MSFLRRRLRHFTWIALFAMLGLGLLPTVSHALAPAGGGWAEVCTARGLTRVDAAGSPVEPGGGPVLHATAHCPFCASGTPVAGPPTVPWRVWLEPIAALSAAPAIRLQPAWPVSWPAAQPRAPPAAR